MVLDLPVTGAVGYNWSPGRKEHEGKMILGWKTLERERQSLHPYPALCCSLSLPSRWGSEPGPASLETRSWLHSAHTPVQLANKRHLVLALGLSSFLPFSQGPILIQKNALVGPQMRIRPAGHRKDCPCFPGDSASGSALINPCQWSEDEFDL